jgi:hypothetical protein
VLSERLRSEFRGDAEEPAEDVLSPSRRRRYGLNMVQDTLSLESLIPTLQLAVGPVILISGVGLLLLCMTNRIGRVIDRARLVADECEAAESGRRDVCYTKLGILCQRARILRASIALAAFSVLLVAVLVILLFCGALLRLEIAGLIVALFVGCMCALIGSLVLFIRDVNLSLKALWLDCPLTGGWTADRGRRVTAATPRGHVQLSA